MLVNSGGSSGPPDLQDPNATLFYFMPSAALDQNGNLGIAYTTSGEYCTSCHIQNHPAPNFDVLPWTATTFDPPTLILQGDVYKRQPGCPITNLIVRGWPRASKMQPSGSSRCLMVIPACTRSRCSNPGVSTDKRKRRAVDGVRFRADFPSQCFA